MTTFLFNMITHHYDSDISKVTSGVIVHGCNAQGVMGSGVAKQLRSKYPEIFDHYTGHLRSKQELGNDPMGSIAFSEVNRNGNDFIIANCITQRFYGRDGAKYVSYEALKKCLDTLAMFKQPIHVPYLVGAGLGGGDEKLILEMFTKTLYNNNLNFHYWK